MSSLSGISSEDGEPHRCRIQEEPTYRWHHFCTSAKAYSTNAAYILGLPTSTQQLSRLAPLYAYRGGAIAAYTAKLLYDSADGQPCTTSKIASAALESALTYTVMHETGKTVREAYLCADALIRGLSGSSAYPSY